ncbi:hypothetical protein BGW80DRAFT_1307465 [Lactifluus volemus]|nr:hypothetical protein BGW80DRAFT_1307465 [Lactifluus volemus]
MATFPLGVFIAFEVAVIAYHISNFSKTTSSRIGLFFSVTTAAVPMTTVISWSLSVRWVKLYRTISLTGCVVCIIAQISILISSIQIPSSGPYAGIMAVTLVYHVRKVVSRRKLDKSIQSNPAHSLPKENGASESKSESAEPLLTLAQWKKKKWNCDSPSIMNWRPPWRKKKPPKENRASESAETLLTLSQRKKCRLPWRKKNGKCP